MSQSDQLKVIDIFGGNITSVPDTLRNLANDIESGEHGYARNLAWVIDCADGRINVGIMGPAVQPAPLAYFLFGLAKRKLEEPE